MKMLRSMTRLLLLALPGILAGDFAELDPEAAAVAEDPQFDPYDDKPRGVGADAEYAPRGRTVESFDFDPSEGLTFYVEAAAASASTRTPSSRATSLAGPTW